MIFAHLTRAEINHMLQGFPFCLLEMVTTLIWACAGCKSYKHTFVISQYNLRGSMPPIKMQDSCASKFNKELHELNNATKFGLLVLSKPFMLLGLLYFGLGTKPQKCV